MSNNSQRKLEKKTVPNSQELAQKKIENRAKLMSLSPSVAQEQVNQVLHPDLWEFNIENHLWEESIPTDYGEIDT
jgi:hypothetical protein